MPLTIGSRIGPYEVTGALGAGGMGEVYRARDTALNRDVALKILAAAFADDAERLARFEREAQVLASLNHTNIAQIYGLEGQEGREGQERKRPRVLVLELVEGLTLADRITQGALPLEEAIEIARQIAAALEAAHEQGIVHRDLKPANVKLRPDGTVKVLDFGLAKALEATSGAAPSSISMSPTLTAATQLGMILGTAAYMAPEQARGKPVDKRADIWAFGCVLFEMLSGRRAFAGEEVSDTLAYVITKDVDWSALPADTPPHIRRLLRRCIEKDPRKRLRDIGEARVALDDSAVRDEPASAVTTAIAPPAPRPSITRRTLPWIAGLAAGSALTATIAIVTRPRSTTAPAQRLSLVIPATTPYVGQIGGELAISPDGTRLVYPAVQGGTRQLFMRNLEQLDAQPIRGTDDAYNPFFSPDGEWIGFFTGGGSGNGKLKKVTVRGGPPLTLADTSVPGGTWLPDDSILFSRGEAGLQVWSIYRVSAGGGTATRVSSPVDRKEQRHAWPSLLPDGRNILLSVTDRGGFDQSHIAVLSLDTGKYQTVVEQGYHARYSRSGHIVYALGANLMAIPFDARRLITTGPPVPIVDGVRARTNTGEMCFGVSSTGFLVYAPGGLARSAQLTLVWVDRTGKEEPLPVPPRAYTYPRLSPDGTRIAIDIRDQENDIWIWDLARRNLTRLTFDPGMDSFPAWMPDGKRIIFASAPSATNMPNNLFWQTADGTGKQERLIESPAGVVPQSVSPDGTRLVFRQSDSTSNFDLYTLPLTGERRPTPLIRTPFAEQNAEVSPDGRWVAYQSTESGQNEIYVRPFPNAESGRWQVSTSGGRTPVWSRDGRELFYLTGPDVRSKLMAATITPGAAFSAATPQALFEGSYLAGGGNQGRTFDVSPDGKRFLMIKDLASDSPTSNDAPLVVVLNFFDELKRIAVPKR